MTLFVVHAEVTAQAPERARYARAMQVLGVHGPKGKREKIDACIKEASTPMGAN